MAQRAEETEADIVARVVAWLRADGWATWQEVQAGSGRADIVARRTGLVWCVEVKKSASLALVEQGLERQRLGLFHGVVLAVPGPKLGVLPHLCDRLGLGLLRAGYRHPFEPAPRPEMRVWPAFDRAADTRRALSLCTEDHAAQAGGVAGGVPTWTPFKSCVRALIKYFEAEGIARMSVREAAELAPVAEYKQRPAAWPKLDDRKKAQALRRWVVQSIEHGWLPGFGLDGAGATRAVTFDRTLISADERKTFRLDVAR